MKILVITTKYPFPPKVGNSIVAYNNIKYLSKNHILDLLCFEPPRESMESPQFVRRVEFVKREKTSRLIVLMRFILDMLLGISPLVTFFKSEQMEKKVKELIELNEFDAILLFEMIAIQYCPASYYNRMIVNIEDLQAIKFKRMARLSIYSPYKRIIYFIAGILTKIYEKKVFPKIAKIVLLSKADIAEMNIEGIYKNLTQVSYGVNRIDEDEILNYEGRDKTIIFSGNMDYPPNVDGALFFLKDIFPLVLKIRPSAVLLIVGANPDYRIREAAQKFSKQVVITGKVDNLLSYIKRATVSICPVRLEVGVQTKVLEALSCGTPVVTTVAGNSGVNGMSGFQLWSEDNPQKFAERVAELLDGIEWLKLSQEGRKLVINNFSWDNSGRQLEALLQDINYKN